MPSGAMFTNSGIFTARFAAVVLSTRIAGLSLPSASMCVNMSCVKGDRPFDEKASQRPFGEKVCQEFIVGVLQFISRALPPWKGTIYNLLSGLINSPLRFCTNTIHLPSGDTLGKLLLIPLADAPATGSAFPPLPSLNGILYRSYWICVSFGSFAYSAFGRPSG